jgi:hypothetical protein
MAGALLRTLRARGCGIGEPTGIDGSRISAAFEVDSLEIAIQGGADLPEPQRIWGSRTGLIAPP